MRELSLVPTCASSDSRSPEQGVPAVDTWRLRPPSTTSTSSSQTLIGMSTNRWRSAWPVIPRVGGVSRRARAGVLLEYVEGIAFSRGVSEPEVRPLPCAISPARSPHG